MIYNIKRILTCIALIGVVGCKTEIDEIRPGGESAGVNFYNASEALNSKQFLRTKNMVFINDSVPNSTFTRFPEFENVSLELADKRQYPFNRTGTIFPDPVVVRGNFQYVYYMPIALGSYKYIFTGTNKIYLKDAVSTLSSANDRQCFYLVEDPSANDAYRVVSVPEEYTGVKDKIRIRIVHLGQDSKNLSIKLLDEKGNLQEVGFPQQLAFGSHSEYVEIDPVNAQRGTGVILSIADSDNPGTPVLNAVVPAAPNGSFVVVIQGYRQDVTRRMPTNRNSDGSLVYTDVSIKANFRITLRRTY